MRQATIKLGDIFGTREVIAYQDKSWVLLCSVCGKSSKKSATGARHQVCLCQRKKATPRNNRTKIGDLFGTLTVVRRPQGRGDSYWVLTCFGCGKDIKRRPYQFNRPCPCEVSSCNRYKIGQIVNGRRVLKTATNRDKSSVSECVSCGYVANFNPTRKRKCRNCGNWKNDQMGVFGHIYGIVCPFTSEVRYVGSTKGRSWSRVIEHIRGRSQKGNSHKPLYIWLQELDSQGAMPGSITLEKVSGDSVHDREVFWIRKLKSEGCMLFNLDHSKGAK